MVQPLNISINRPFKDNLKVSIAHNNSEKKKKNEQKRLLINSVANFVSYIQDSRRKAR